MKRSLSTSLLVVVYQIHNSVLWPSPTAKFGLTNVSGSASKLACCPAGRSGLNFRPFIGRFVAPSPLISPFPLCPSTCRCLHQGFTAQVQFPVQHLAAPAFFLMGVTGAHLVFVVTIRLRSGIGEFGELQGSGLGVEARVAWDSHTDK